MLLVEAGRGGGNLGDLDLVRRVEAPVDVVHSASVASAVQLLKSQSICSVPGALGTSLPLLLAIDLG